MTSNIAIGSTIGASLIIQGGYEAATEGLTLLNIGKVALGIIGVINAVSTDSQLRAQNQKIEELKKSSEIENGPPKGPVEMEPATLGLQQAEQPASPLLAANQPIPPVVAPVPPNSTTVEPLTATTTAVAATTSGVESLELSPDVKKVVNALTKLKEWFAINPLNQRNSETDDSDLEAMLVSLEEMTKAGSTPKKSDVIQKISELEKTINSAAKKGSKRTIKYTALRVFSYSKQISSLADKYYEYLGPGLAVDKDKGGYSKIGYQAANTASENNLNDID